MCRSTISSHARRQVGRAVTNIEAHPPSAAQPHHQWLNWSPAGAPARQLREVLRDLANARGIGGIYLIWSELGAARHWLFVGEASDIGTRLPHHQSDVDRAGQATAQLYVAWAPVAAVNRAGVLRYLVEILAPQGADPLSAARPMPVNLPQ